MRATTSAAVATLLLAAGCTGSSGGPGPASSPSSPTAVAPAAMVMVSPADALFDTPVSTVVSGLAPGSRVTLTLSSQSAQQVTWSASAVFEADDHGRASTVQAPVSGDYTGADPMGLVEALSPGHVGEVFAAPTPWTMTMTASVNGARVGSAQFTRETSPAFEKISTTEERPTGGGLYGELLLPVGTAARPGPAVVVIGGSEGGLSTTVQAGALAAHGFPALALAYFAEPGLPATLSRIPLEYFAAAARFLAGRPGVDPKKVVLWGTSRGSEAALLTAADFPDLVHGAIGSVPGAEAYGGYPDFNSPAWTLNGRPVATAPATDFLSPNPTGTGAIPVEKIDGPLFLVCGGQDQVWDSCDNVAAIRTRLTAHHSVTQVTALNYPGAGHFVGSMYPYLPSTTSTGTTATGQVLNAGGTYLADQSARAQAWPKLLAFLDAQR